MNGSSNRDPKALIGKPLAFPAMVWIIALQPISILLVPMISNGESVWYFGERKEWMSTGDIGRVVRLNDRNLDSLLCKVSL